ncbi:MAG: 23S rRNA (adenine(2030)-N(6))-methyltransferase RlmJ, partial [Candidatus Protistobacter heckmanni]|nr:23S rRNA (adenine(2030)-N(6))-methyltransferase RlmJ [Candidatus Protistobacter heckmanni]
MLSYRHAFHAGNHADVLKHTVLILLLDYLAQKPKPLLLADTHAGAGAYDLLGDYAQKSGEYTEGVLKLWNEKKLPEALARYLEIVRATNDDGALRYYPGSPAIADALLRDEDKLRLFEMHPTDLKLLQQNFARQRSGTRARVQVAAGDGFDGLKSVLPPPSRRGLVLIDPAYELKTDYRRVVDALDEGLKRFATGVYAVWYPCLQRAESRQLPGDLRKLAERHGVKGWLQAEIAVDAIDGEGLKASGMFVLNPPWTLKAALQESLPVMARLLGQGPGAGWRLDGRE